MITGVQTRPSAASGTVYAILFAISAVHLMNDSMQTVVIALFPIFEKSLNLSFAQMGWITFALNMTSSIMQPIVGIFSDKHPSPRMLPIGMGLSMLGMAGLAFAPHFWLLMLSVVFVGLGSAIFHPEGSRVVYFAAGGRRSFAQSIYQVGGNAGQSLAPLMTIFIFLPLGQPGAIWGTLLAASAIAILVFVVPWYRKQLEAKGIPVKLRKTAAEPALAAGTDTGVALAMVLLIFIVFARSWYAAGIGNFYQFFLRDDYGLTISQAQVPIFMYMAAGVAGTFFGGIWGDRFGRKAMIIFSVAGAAPFALLLPYLPLGWIYPVITVLGFIMMSGFSVSVVYAQELMPRNVGMASGLIVGLAFGMGALGAVVLGSAATNWGLTSVMNTISYLPLIGVLAFVLPKDRRT
jgi:FSR family fosmidomycin resistance protein-like MFS transporter